MKQFRCYKCCDVPYFAPVLRQSGYDLYSGRDVVCPICNTFYNSRTGEEFDIDAYNKRQEVREANREYNRYWWDSN